MRIVVLIAALAGTVLFSGEATVKCRNRCQNRLIAEKTDLVFFVGIFWTATKWGPNADEQGLVAGPANQMDPAEHNVYLAKVHQACARLDEECGQGGGGSIAVNDPSWDGGWIWNAGDVARPQLWI